MRVLRFVVVGRAILLHRPIEIVVALVIDVWRTRPMVRLSSREGSPLPLSIRPASSAFFSASLESTAHLLLILEDGKGHVPAPFERDMRSATQMFQGLAGLSEFGGSAWEFDEASGQYHFRAFLKSQPDLNWRNPEVVEAMHDVLRFWMRKAVDGFRVDVIWHLIKDAALRDNPPNPNYQKGKPPNEALIPLYTTDLPEVHDVIAILRRTVDEFSDRLLIGEIYLPVERLIAYYGPDLGGVHLPFNFALLGVHWDAKCIQALISEYEGTRGGGQTGCLAITIGRVSPVGSAKDRPPSRPCCC
jgi:hypothetical protein